MSRHDPHAVPPPPEPWKYMLDDEPPELAAPNSGRLLVPGHHAIRLAPDTEHRAWRNEYLMLTEGNELPLALHLEGALHLHAEEVGGVVLDFWATVDDPLDACLVFIHGARGDLFLQVLDKVQKALDWYSAALDRRDSGQPMPAIHGAP